MFPVLVKSGGHPMPIEYPITPTINARKTIISSDPPVSDAHGFECAELLQVLEREDVKRLGPATIVPSTKAIPDRDGKIEIPVWAM
jgi:hypothetical protein